MPMTAIKFKRCFKFYPFKALTDTRGTAYPETCMLIKLQDRGQQCSTAKYGHEKQQKQCPQHVAHKPNWHSREQCSRGGYNVTSFRQAKTMEPPAKLG